VVLDQEEKNKKNMKKLSDYREDYQRYTAKLSDVNRNIALAGIALVWIFRKTSGDSITITSELVLPSILLISALGFDMLQYLYQSIVWAIFYRHHEKKLVDDNTEILAPVEMNYASWVLFGLKVLSVIVAYGFLLNFLIDNLMCK